MKRVAILVTAGALALAACGGSGDGVTVSDIRLGEPTGPNAGLYLTVEVSEADRLLGGSTDIASMVMTHETEMSNDGHMSMVHVDGFDIEPGEPLVLEPGGKHLMLMDADRVSEGDTVEVTLMFENYGEMTIEAPVVAPQMTMDEE